MSTNNGSTSQHAPSTPARPLPRPIYFPEFIKLADIDIAEIVEGILHRLTKMSIGGGSKSKKSWLLTDLALAVAYGKDWLGFKTKRHRVLYVNLEIPEVFFAKRVKIVQEIRKLPDEGDRSFAALNLRGYNEPYEQMIPKIIDMVRDDGFGLIIIDPIYKLLGSADENKANDIALMLNAIERLSEEVCSAVSFSAHFSKGNQAAKEAIDRVSGSGVFARDPDTIMSITQHEEPDCFTVDLVMRNQPPVRPFVIEWTYPVFNRVDLDPSRLRKEAGGRPAGADATEILSVLDPKGMSGADWQMAAEQELAFSPNGFKRARQILVRKGMILRDGKRWISTLPV